MRKSMAVPKSGYWPDSATGYEDPDGSVLRQIQDLQQMTVRELQAKHAELFGLPTRSKHKQQLFKRIAWRVQELHWGGLSDRTQRRLDAIANDLDARFLPPRKPKVVPIPRRPRRDGLVPGTVLEREYHGVVHRVTVLNEGIEYEGRQYRSLSAVARAITGTQWNGRRFFGLVDAKGGRP